MVSCVSLSPSKYIKHTVLFGFLLVTVSIHLSVYKVLLLLVGGVQAIVELVRVLNFARGARLVAS